MIDFIIQCKIVADALATKAMSEHVNKVKARCIELGITDADLDIKTRPLFPNISLLDGDDGSSNWFYNDGSPQGKFIIGFTHIIPDFDTLSYTYETYYTQKEGVKLI